MLSRSVRFAMRGFAGLCLAVLIPCAGIADEPSTAVIATIDGEPVAVGEFLLHLNAQRGRVYARFQALARVEDTDRFWHADYHGVTPWAFLKAQALEDLKAVKVQQGEARRAGLIDDTSYAAFRRRFEDENRRRAAAVEKGEPVYGPVQVGEWEFYNYELAQLVLRLKRRLAEDALQVSAVEARQYFEQHKVSRYRAPDTVSAEVYENFESSVRRDCLDEKYRAFVQALVAKASLVIEQPVYDGVDP